MVNAKGGRAPSSAPPTGSSAERSPAASAPHKGIAGAASPRPPAADPSAAPGPPPAARPRLGSAPAAPREEPPAACRAPARAPRPQLPSAPRPLPRAEIIHQNKRAAAAAILGVGHMRPPKEPGMPGRARRRPMEKGGRRCVKSGMGGARGGASWRGGRGGAWRRYGNGGGREGGKAVRGSLSARLEAGVPVWQLSRCPVGLYVPARLSRKTLWASALRYQRGMESVAVHLPGSFEPEVFCFLPVERHKLFCIASFRYASK